MSDALERSIRNAQQAQSDWFVDQFNNSGPVQTNFFDDGPKPSHGDDFAVEASADNDGRSKRRMRAALGLFVASGASLALLASGVGDTETQTPANSTIPEDKEVEYAPIDPSQCDFSYAALNGDVGQRIEEYRQCQQDHQLGLPGVTD